MDVSKMRFSSLNLHLFDEGGAGAPNGGATPTQSALPVSESKKASKNPLANVVYGKQTQPQNAEPATPPTTKTQKDGEPSTKVTSVPDAERKAQFDALIKGEYKDLYDARVQQNIAARFKDMDALKAKAAQVDSLNPVLDLLANKYGVDSSDVDKLVKAIQDDDSYYEEEAESKGISVQQLKDIKRLERENAQLKAITEEKQQQQAQQSAIAMWQQQADALKGIYPNLDFEAEVQHPETGARFAKMLGAGVDVRTAYEIIHKDDIIGGAMQYTAQAVQQKTVNDIRARGMRPTENAASGNSAAAIVKADPSKFTKRDREEISRRVRAGERISL